MTATNLEKRVEALEREVQQLKLTLNKVEELQQPWWKRLAGTFNDDPLFDDMVEAGKKYRQSLRPKSK